MFIAIAILLQDPKKQLNVVTVSPLKRLQSTQVNEFQERWGIPTMAVNESTPKDTPFWKKFVYDCKKGKMGYFRHFIVTPEQLFFDHTINHTPLFGKFLRTYRIFQEHTCHIIIDECHFTHVAGLSHNGEPPFRPKYALFDELRARLRKGIRWHAMTATLPNHMLKTVEKKILGSDYHLTKATSNRKNIIYINHLVVGSLQVMQNYECFLTKPYDNNKQPRVLIFFNSTSLLQRVSSHLESLLPPEEQDIVCQYYSDMSNTYLERIHREFTAEDGRCKILCATAGLAQGVDFPDVEIVCTVDVPPSIVESIQRGGRGGRQSGSASLFITFYEQWALDISVDDFSQGDQNNPDRSLVSPLPKRPTVRQRATLSSIRLIQCMSCLRAFYAQELNDTAPDALDYDTIYCCSGHPEDPINLSSILPSPIFTVEAYTALQDVQQQAEAEKKKRAQARYRPVNERAKLDEELIQWVDSIVSSGDPAVHHDFIYADDILPHSTRKALVMTNAPTYRKAKSLKDIIQDTDEWHELWGEQILDLVKKYGVKLRKQK
ncbi:P-loop containing nucleoside triphosphate hydrolase protein [Coprinopsis sp. MPI-PUGE-AT-0042]|nr:P-loop containing nucleoside triphosphate hydrolase protein [Coprinopsis sp. MPI-PUGE-AT-0042]